MNADAAIFILACAVLLILVRAIVVHNNQTKVHIARQDRLTKQALSDFRRCDALARIHMHALSVPRPSPAAAWAIEAIETATPRASAHAERYTPTHIPQESTDVQTVPAPPPG